MGKKHKRKSSGGYYSGGYETIWVNTCKHYPTYLFNIGELNVWAADIDGVKRAPDGAVVLNCTGLSRHNHHFGRFSQRLSQHLVVPNETLQLDWTDGDSPPVKDHFWRELPFALLDEGTTDLVIHCIGGHGRTGTALASLLIMSLGFGGQEAIDWVQKNYCSLAIETKKQERYLYFMSGEPFRDTSSKSTSNHIGFDKCKKCGWYNCCEYTDSKDEDEPVPESGYLVDDSIYEKDVDDSIEGPVVDGDNGNVVVVYKEEDEEEEDEEDEIYYDCSQCASPRLQFGPCYNCGWEDVPKGPTVSDWETQLKEGLQELRDEEAEVAAALQEDETSVLSYDDAGNPVVWDPDAGCWVEICYHEILDDYEMCNICETEKKPSSNEDDEEEEWDTWADRLHWWR